MITDGMRIGHLLWVVAKTVHTNIPLGFHCESVNHIYSKQQVHAAMTLCSSRWHDFFHLLPVRQLSKTGSLLQIIVNTIVKAHLFGAFRKKIHNRCPDLPVRNHVQIEWSFIGAEKFSEFYITLRWDVVAPWLRRWLSTGGLWVRLPL